MKAKLERIRELVQAGRFTVSKHSLVHRLKEGFSVDDMIYAVLHGKLIEDYPERQRCLIYAEVPLTARMTIPLHVVCDYSDEEWIDLVTAYIPAPEEWETPIKRQKR